MKSFQETTSADNKVIGFDYQYYYFLYLLLNLKQGEKIGLEVKDDIHIDCKDGKQILLQLKHSVLTNSTGSAINLTELDKDLWKTISNWVKVINDSNEGRKTLAKQQAFIKNTIFLLISNKSSNESNKFLKNVTKLKKRKMLLSEFKTYLDELYEATKDKEIKDYINTLKTQKDKWIELFIKKLNFELNEDDLIIKIKGAIREKLVKENRINYVFESLDSNIRRNNYITVKKREKIVITFEEFRKNAETYFEKARDSRLPVRKKVSNFSGDLLSQTFIKQLLDIDILEEDNIEEILKLTGYKMQAYINLETWEQEGDITTSQREQFEKDSILQWKNIFNQTHIRLRKRWEKEKDTVSEDQLIEHAQNCYFKVIEKILEFENNRFDMEFSNGQFYLLSDTPSIGWKIDWEDKYK